MSELRRVKVKLPKNYKIEPYIATFHKFVQDPDSESCALVELDDGSVKVIDVTYINFITE